MCAVVDNACGGHEGAILADMVTKVLSELRKFELEMIEK